MTLLFYVKEPGRIYSSATIEHILPVSRGGADSDHNHVAACYLCNVLKNDFDKGLLFANLMSELHQNAELRNKWHHLTEEEFNIVRRFIQIELFKRDKDYAFYRLNRRYH